MDNTFIGIPLELNLTHNTADNKKSIHYVYAYLDTRKQGKYIYDGLDFCFMYEPFYIGKGYASRHVAHLRDAKNPNIRNYKVHKIRKIIRETGNPPIVVKLVEDITDNKARSMEIKVIKSIGRLDKKLGTLLNLTDGGEGVSGKIFSKEERAKLSKMFSGKNNPNYGNGDKIRGSKNPMWGVDRSGSKAPNYGVKFSNDHRNNISKGKQGRCIDEENPNWRGGSSRGKPCPNCGTLMCCSSKICNICDKGNRSGKNNSNYGNRWGNFQKIKSSINNTKYKYNIINIDTNVKFKNIVLFVYFCRKFNIKYKNFSFQENNAKWKNWIFVRQEKNLNKLSKFDEYYINDNCDGKKWEIINNKDNMEAMKEMEDNSFDLAIVDPPYGLPKGSVHGGGKLKNIIIQGMHKKGWDIAPPAEYFKELFRVSKNQIIWGGNYFNLPPNRGFIVWDKKQPWPNFSACEYAWNSIDGVSKIFRFNNRTKGKIHPTEKPVALYKWLLEKYAKKADKILDTHLGSGSIAIACYDLGFNLTGYELDNDYFDDSCDRIKKHIDNKESEKSQANKLSNFFN